MQSSACGQCVRARACVVLCPWELVQHSCSKMCEQNLVARPTMGTVHLEAQHYQGSMLLFTFKSHPSIYHIIVDRGNDEVDTDKIFESNDKDVDSSDDIFNDEDRIIVAQRVCLNRHEKNCLVEILSVQDYVGVLFVIRFTSTNLNKNDMVTRPPLSCMAP